MSDIICKLDDARDTYGIFNKQKTDKRLKNNITIEGNKNGYCFPKSNGNGNSKIENTII